MVEIVPGTLVALYHNCQYLDPREKEQWWPFHPGHHWGVVDSINEQHQDVLYVRRRIEPTKPKNSGWSTREAWLLSRVVTVHPSLRLPINPTPPRDLPPEVAAWGLEATRQRILADITIHRPVWLPDPLAARLERWAAARGERLADALASILGPPFPGEG